MLASQAATHPAGAVAQVVGELARLTGARGLIAGEAADIAAEGEPPDEAVLTYIHEKKTAALFEASARAGAILASAPAEGLEAITDYAYSVGRVFQITDDILDVVGDAAKMGKVPGGDARLGKATFPKLCGVEGSRALADEFAARARAAADQLPARRDFWLGLVDFLLARES
jgi:geranylgeranyl diphosphate synthase type II